MSLDTELDLYVRKGRTNNNVDAYSVLFPYITITYEEPYKVGNKIYGVRYLEEELKRRNISPLITKWLGENVIVSHNLDEVGIRMIGAWWMSDTSLDNIRCLQTEVKLNKNKEVYLYITFREDNGELIKDKKKQAMATASFDNFNKKNKIYTSVADMLRSVEDRLMYGTIDNKDLFQEPNTGDVLYNSTLNDDVPLTTKSMERVIRGVDLSYDAVGKNKNKLYLESVDYSYV